MFFRFHAFFFLFGDLENNRNEGFNEWFKASLRIVFGLLIELYLKKSGKSFLKSKMKKTNTDD